MTLYFKATITDTKDEESRLSFCKNMELHESTMSNDLGDESEIEECENPMEAKIDQMVALIMYYFALKCGESFEDEAQIFGEFASGLRFRIIVLWGKFLKGHFKMSISKVFRP
jgi:hypothetical protein